MEVLSLKFIGESPLMMHSEKGANPLDENVKYLKTITGKKKKTDEDHQEIARLDWQLGMYFDEKIGPYLPGINIRAAIVAGGKMNKLGTNLQKGTMILEEMLKLEYDGPRTVDELWANSAFRDIRSVVVSQSRTMRCRPFFREWAVAFDILFDPKVIDKADVLMSAENAGKFIGIGDFRPGKGNGICGRFKVLAG